MAEILAPARPDLAGEFARGFEGMTDAHVTLDQLLQAREELIAGIVGCMPPAHRRFLLSIKRCEPDWTLLGVIGADRLPPVRWRLEKLRKLDVSRRSILAGRLSELLGVE
jgi:hypothetical protein